MTISSTIRKAGPFIGNGSASSFPFTYKVFQASDLEVVRLDTSTNIETVLTLTTNYTVTLNQDQNSNPGGTVVLVGGPLATGYTLIMTSDVPNLQPTDLTNQGGFYPEVINDALDRATIQIQQLEEQLGRTLKTAVSSTVDTTLPPPSANDLIGWDATGQSLANIDPASLATVVAYATAYCDVFVGDGVTQNWTLTRNPAVIYNLDVSINGSTQEPVRDYTITGTTFSMTTPPPLNSRVVVKYKEGLPNYEGDSQDVRFVPAGAGAVTTTVQAKLRQTVSVKDFGAVGDGVTDDTNAFQLLADYLRANNAYKNLGDANASYGYVPPGRYKITKSLDFTSAGGNSDPIGMSLIGADPINTILDAHLDEQYPVLDLSGNTRSSVRGIGIRGNYVDNEASCGILIQDVTSGGGGSCNLDFVLVEMNSDGTNANAIAGVVVNNADLTQITNRCEFKGPTGLAIGLQLPVGVSSKYQTTSVTGNATNYWIVDFVATGQLPLWFTGSAAISLDNAYLAVTNTGSSFKTAFLVTGGSSGNCVRARNLRIENQASATEFYGVYFKDGSLGVDISGDITCSPAVTCATIKTDPVNLTGVTLQLTTADGTEPVFNADGYIQNLFLRTNASVLGTVNNGIFGADIGYNIPPSEVEGVIRGPFTLQSYGTAFSSMSNAQIFGDNSVKALASAASYIPAETTTSYTGGSGTHTWKTYTVPAKFLSGVSGGPYRSLKAIFGFSVGTVASLTVGFQLRQTGTNSVYSGSFVTSEKAKITIDIVNVSANSALRMLTDVSTTSTQTAAVESAGTDIDTTQDWYLDITLNSNASNPVTMIASKFVVE